MSEATDILARELPIRLAVEEDLEDFLALWMEFLIDREKNGGDFVANDKALRYFETIFNLYVTGERKGVCLIAGSESSIQRYYGKGRMGVTLWGEGPADYIDFARGPVAMGWGVYVRPEFRRTGLSLAMRELAADELRRLGFRRVTGGSTIPEPLREEVTNILVPDAGAAITSAERVGFRAETVTGSFFL